MERDRLSILLAVTLISATLLRFVELPTVTWSVRRIFGSPLGFSLGGDWLLSLLMMGLIVTGTFSLLQNHPHPEQRDRALGFSLITPALGALLLSFLLVRATSWPLWLAALTAGGLGLGLLIHLTYRAYSPLVPGYAQARTILNVADYVMGFVIFSLILNDGSRALIVGPEILVISGLLGLDLLSASGAPTKTILRFGAILAVLEGELTWVLGYWPLSSWAAATLLTLGIYLGCGIGYQYLLNRLTRRTLIEFLGMALLLFVFVLWVRP